ncbi:MAG: 50S ribosomal protein L13 [Candidatus Thermoplasmatota archaeon]
MAIIDAEGQILGRLASKIAKRLLANEEIVVVNCEKTIITGSKEDIVANYKEKLYRGSQRKGPYFPKTPDRIFSRTVRGMLPFDRAKGKNAYRNLRVYIGLPSEFANQEKEKLDAPKIKNRKFVSLSAVSKELGAWVKG